VHHAPITFAHRGARDTLPDNTLRAFRRALELGARGLESDARCSSDGQVVLVHGPTARRGLLRSRRVAAATAADLADLEVPRLADLYEVLGTDFELSLDVYDPNAGEHICDVADAAGATDRLWLCSANRTLLERLRRRAPAANLVHSVRRRKLDVSPERHAALLAESGIQVVNMHRTDWTSGLVSLYRRFGLQVFAWDVQEVRHFREVLQLDIDGVYSDHVDRMVAVISEWTAG
jgi:glycerophosphoryl diester phosphodiesterase